MFYFVSNFHKPFHLVNFGGWKIKAGQDTYKRKPSRHVYKCSKQGEAEFLFRIDSKSWQDSLAAIRILFTQRFFTITDFVVRYIIDHRSGR